MYKVKVIPKNALIELYGGAAHITVFSNDYMSGNITQLLPNKPMLDVTVAHKAGPYSIVILDDLSAANRRRVIIPSRIISMEERVESYVRFKPILDRVIGEGNWKYSHSEGRLLLVYPELTLTNSMDNKHTIRNLIVGFRMDVSGAISGDLLGVRSTLTDVERAGKYAHSHLDTSIGYLQSFCQGKATPISKYMASLNRALTDEEFEQFLHQLKEYLVWESLEGRPYRFIATIGKTDGAMPQYRGHFPTWTREHETEQEIDNLARHIVVMLKDSPQLVMESRIGWVINPGIDPKAYFDIERKLYDLAGDWGKRTLFTEYDTQLDAFNPPEIMRNMQAVSYHEQAQEWFSQLGLTPEVVATPVVQTTSASIIKMPYQTIREILQRRVNVLLVMAEQSMNNNGQGIIIDDKATSEDLAAVDAASPLPA